MVNKILIVIQNKLRVNLPFQGGLGVWANTTEA